YCSESEYTVFKIDPEHHYIEIENHNEILQLASLDVNATLDARKLRKSKTDDSKKRDEPIKPSINHDFLYKYEYDSLMNLAMSYQMQADSLKWIIDEKRDLFGQTSDGQSRAKLSNEIIALERQVYQVQKNADSCYERVREIEQINLATKKMSYESQDNLSGKDESTQKTDFSETARSQDEYAFHEDSLHKLEIDTNRERDDDFVFGLKINTPSVYNQKNPIPVNEKLPSGIIYMIQMGAFSSPKNPEIFKGLEPLTTIKNTNSEIRKYFAGKFRTVSQAEKSLPKVKSKGFKDAFIVAFKDGKTIPVNQAVKLESKQPAREVSDKDTENEDVENIKDLSIIYTVNFTVMIEDTAMISEIKPLLAESKDIYLEKYNDRYKVTIKSFDNFDEAFVLKDKIEQIVNKGVEVFAYFAEHQIPLDQAVKMTQ
ncbi:MAG: SPOR domain-containing protein, partial [Bacteroidota bacterium]